MKTETFTIRDLSRQTAKVLAAAERHGAVLVRARDGKSFSIRAEAEEPRAFVMPDFAARRRELKALGLVVPPRSNKAEWERINRIIAGEE